MTTYASDTFNRSDNSSSLGTADTGGAWTAHIGTWGIISNVAYVPGSVNDNHNHASLGVAQNDVTVSCDVFLSATLNRAAAGIELRYADDNNWLKVYLFKTTAVANSILIQQYVAASYTPLAEVTSAGLVNGNTYNLKAVISGTTIAVYLDGVLKISPTSFNSGLTAQNYGLTMYKSTSDYDDGTSAFDNFLVTDNASTFTGYPRPQQAVYRM